ncbi:hypothetical protein pdam_00023841 [Paramuricea clavata]|uniref:Uncharacterized protein n=1 Tax=Paramuricea clavata TaxID=317549 RepID=A0A7D9HZC5_PARCT|nr:hypothetical protein pdam_00023841 [Paramuricea clavata]
MLGETLTTEDIRLINSAITRLETWPKAFTDAANLRKQDIRKRDVNEKLSTDDFKSFICSERVKEIMRMYDTVAKEEKPTVSVNDFSSTRDYLLLWVLMGSGQRCGAASNLTIKEYVDGAWTESDGKKIYATKTLRHKTSSGGPAKLLWDQQIKGFGDIYLEKLRDMFDNRDMFHMFDNSAAPAAVGIPEMPVFFISSHGNPMNESRASHRLASMGKQENKDEEENKGEQPKPKGQEKADDAAQGEEEGSSDSGEAESRTPLCISRQSKT